MGSWFAVLCLFPDFTVVCVWLQTTSLSNWIRYKSVFFYFRLWKAHVFKSYKKGWKWRYYEVKTLSSLFLYFKRIMVDCYRAINQGIKFGNIWEHSRWDCSQREPCWQRPREGDIGEIFSRVHPSWGQVTKGFVSERLGSNLSVWLCNEWQCLFVCNESFGGFFGCFFFVENINCSFHCICRVAWKMCLWGKSVDLNTVCQ